MLGYVKVDSCMYVSSAICVPVPQKSRYGIKVRRQLPGLRLHVFGES